MMQTTLRIRPFSSSTMGITYSTRIGGVLLILVLTAVLFSCDRDGAQPQPRTFPLDVKLLVSFEKVELFTDSLLTMSFVWETGTSFAPIDKSLWVSIRFRDRSGKLLWEVSHIPEPPTTKWRPSQLVRYNRTVYVPPTMTETEASVLVELYDDRASDCRYTISAPTGLSDTPWLAPVGKLRIKPRPSLFESPSRANLIFESGFYSVERDGKQDWRWTSKEARAKLERLNQRGVLFLSGEVNLQHLKTVPTITVSLGGQIKTSFSPESETGRFQRKIIVADEDFGESNWLDMSIECSETFIPSKSAESEDDRELGIRLMKMYFGPAAP